MKYLILLAAVAVAAGLFAQQTNTNSSPPVAIAYTPSPSATNAPPETDHGQLTTDALNAAVAAAVAKARTEEKAAGEAREKAAFQNGFIAGVRAAETARLEENLPALLNRAAKGFEQSIQR